MQHASSDWRCEKSSWSFEGWVKNLLLFFRCQIIYADLAAAANENLMENLNRKRNFVRSSSQYKLVMHASTASSSIYHYLVCSFHATWSGLFICLICVPRVLPRKRTTLTEEEGKIHKRIEKRRKLVYQWNHRATNWNARISLSLRMKRA